MVISGSRMGTIPITGTANGPKWGRPTAQCASLFLNYPRDFWPVLVDFS
jgi:hypothetical protein